MNVTTSEIRSREQLLSFAVAKPWRWFAVQPKISLQIDSVERDLLRSTENRMNFWLGVCGCQAGALYVLSAVAWLFWGSYEFEFALRGVLYGCATVIGSGIAGKVAALLGARVLLVADAALFSWRTNPDRIGNRARKRRIAT